MRYIKQTYNHHKDTLSDVAGMLMFATTIYLMLFL